MTYITNLTNAIRIAVPTTDQVAAEALSRLSGACPEALLADLLQGESFECSGFSFIPAVAFDAGVRP